MDGSGVRGWLAGRDRFRVVASQLPGEFPPASDYVEMFWLPSIGPSCVFAARRFALWLSVEPEGFDLELADLARAIGLGSSTAPGSPVARCLGRLVQFGWAELAGDAFAARLLIPRLSASDLQRYERRRLVHR